jgi:hypothetical protein
LRYLLEDKPAKQKIVVGVLPGTLCNMLSAIQQWMAGQDISQNAL